MAEAKRRLGVPYARAIVIDGILFHKCPVCGSLIEEVTDRYGEAETNMYGLHYVRFLDLVDTDEAGAVG